MDSFSIDYIKCSKRSVRVKNRKLSTLEFTNTKRRVFVFGDGYNYDKIGHIEVSVTENECEHFAERLEKFLNEACDLYNKIVLGNENIHCEFTEVKNCETTEVKTTEVKKGVTNDVD